MIKQEKDIFELINNLNLSISNATNYFAYHDFIKPICVTNTYDIPTAQLNIDRWDLGLKGGTFIINKGDVGFIFCSHDDEATQLCIKAVSKFLSFMKSKGIEIVQDNNDFLIDGYKVCGFTHACVEKCILYAMSFNFNVDLDLIKSICTKPMIKIPKSLADYGITQEEIINLITSLNN